MIHRGGQVRLLDWNETLSALQGMLGEHVEVGIAAPGPPDGPGRPWAMFAGVLLRVSGSDTGDEQTLEVGHPQTDADGLVVSGNLCVARSDVVQTQQAADSVLTIVAKWRTVVIAPRVTENDT